MNRELYRCTFTGCDRRDLTAAELYQHGVDDHLEPFGAGYLIRDSDLVGTKRGEDGVYRMETWLPLNTMDEYLDHQIAGHEARVPWWSGVYGLAYLAWCVVTEWGRDQRDGFLIGYYARRLLDDDLARPQTTTLEDSMRDQAIHGVSYSLMTRNEARELVGLRRIDPRDVWPVIIRPLGPLEFAFLFAWSFLWLALVWAAATGRL